MIRLSVGDARSAMQRQPRTPHQRADRSWAIAAAVMCALFVNVHTSSAQSAASSTIQGNVKDESGGTMPGVTITLTSPALQVGQMTAVTDAEGNYRFSELPAGTYRLTFELQGFQKFVRDELRVTVGFVARVNATMAVGALEETVTVSGQSPVVDLTTTSTAANFTQEVLENVPRGRDLWAVLNMTPGVTMTGNPDVGGSAMTARSSMQTFGVSAQPRLDIEGINVTTGPDENSAVYLNYSAFDEVQVKTSGNDAEVGPPGIYMVAVLKSGGNEFHGKYAASYEGSSMQSANIDDRLREQGLRDTEPLKYHYDVAGDLGGRIIRDKLWFYGNMSRQQRVSQLLGFVSGPGPDGRYLTGDEPGADYFNTLDVWGIKGSWQLTRNNRLIGVYQQGTKLQPQNGAGRFRPLEATRDYRDPTWVYKGEIQSTLTDRTLLNVVAGYGGYFADYQAARGCCAGPDRPSRFDRETSLRTGSHEASDQRPRDRWMADGGISFYPEKFLGGRHEMKTGGTASWQHHATGLLNHAWGNYVLVYDRVGGVSGQPTEIQIFNYPVEPDNRQYTYAWYLKDTWRISSNFTANVGVRWERQQSLLVKQAREASPQFPQLFPAGEFPARTILTWYRTVPRVGFAWDLNSKTVVKGTFGIYSYVLGDDFASLYNQNALITATYRWRDLDRNNNYTPGEVNLDLNGPDFISVTGARNNIPNPNLRQPKTTEVTASFERELAENLGVRTVYVYKRLKDFFSTTNGGLNILRPAGVYNIPITRRDPGADGILNTPDDGGRVTFYDYDPAYRGAAFVGNQVVNHREDDWFHTIEFAVNKRFSKKWTASGSYFIVKNHRWITRVIQSPNDLFFPVDETWSWASNATGTYRLPWDIQLAGFLQAKAGIPGQRTYIFRAQDPDGGTPLRQLSTQMLRLEPFGTRRGAAIKILNLRASKEFSLNRQRLGIDFDAFNVLNSNAPNDITWASGPTFGYVTEITAPRVFRVGARYSF